MTVHDRIVAELRARYSSSTPRAIACSPCTAQAMSQGEVPELWDGQAARRIVNILLTTR